MRMHRKAHLDERLLSCGDILTVADMTDKNMRTAAEKPAYIDWEGVFKNKNPINLEIGCGKGKFVTEMAKNNNNVNFVAIEKISNVLIEALERAKAEGIENVHFINCAAEVLPKYFKEGSVEKIYLNFSNPLPKEGYKKQRLTHPKFLEMYGRILKDGGKIIQKTDDGDFYAFSLESYLKSGFEIEERCEDYQLAAGDVETEHERLFKERGKKIFRIVAVKA